MRARVQSVQDWIVTNYQTIFDAVEASLIRAGAQHQPELTIRQRLHEFKRVASKQFTDAGYFDLLICIPFYSGFKAQTVEEHKAAIQRHFCDYETVAAYERARVTEILADPDMIRNQRKVQACVDNARAFQGIVRQHGSFRAYVDSFQPKSSVQNLMQLRDDLTRRFAYLGKITVYHFLTDIGMPVLKPDRVIRRVFFRLGLIESTGESESQLLEVIAQGERFAQATGHPMRYIDIVFVLYGQVESPDFGLEKGICLEEHPHCGVCDARPYCRFPI